MKITTIIFLVTLGTLFISEYSEPAYGYGTGAPAAQTGSPSDGSNCTSCHSGVITNSVGVITSNIPSSGYVPGNTYTITATVNAASINKFGFQISPQNISGNLKGIMVIINGTETQLISSGKYITHKTNGTAGTGIRTWSFKWVAPATGSGSVTFYGAFVLANANGTTSGDQVKLSNMVIAEDLSTDIAETATNADGWNVYPVPASDRLFVKNVNENYKVTSISIFDVAGKLVKTIYKGEVFHDESVNISDLQSGIYTMYIVTEVGITKKKIIRN